MNAELIRPDRHAGLVFIPDSIGYYVGTNYFAKPAFKYGRLRLAKLALLLVGCCAFLVSTGLRTSSVETINCGLVRLNAASIFLPADTHRLQHPAADPTALRPRAGHRQVRFPARNLRWPGTRFSSAST